jgi:hypothetical protein
MTQYEDITVAVWLLALDTICMIALLVHMMKVDHMRLLLQFHLRYLV